MSVSSVNQGVYSAYSYQWKQQQLQGTVSNNTTSNSSSSSGAYSFNGSSTVSSMVELSRKSVVEGTSVVALVHYRGRGLSTT